MKTRAGGIDIADLAMLAVILSWGASNIFTKSALDDDSIQPLSYIFFRFTIAIVFLGLVLLFRRRFVPVDPADYRQFLLAGITGYGLYNLLFTAGLSRTSAFSAAILVAVGPIFTLLFAQLLGIEQVNRVQWLGVAIAFAGVCIFVGEKLVEGKPAAGDMLNLVAAACWAIYTLGSRPLVIKYGSPVTTFWSVVIGFCFILPVTLIDLAENGWQEIAAKGWFAAAYAAIVAMVVGYSIWGWAIARSGAGRTVPFIFLIPVVTGTLSYLFLDERFSIWQIIGAGLVLGGVFLALQGARRAANRDRKRNMTMSADTMIAPEG